ncbi:hypothetical protein GCM10007423_09740 [Dyadobacter endophyticus]|uniref:Uncharacterized protein n=1 Tax=Dyadobacter endophyticus TaxID=1749036 RepID=A0ABQ1YHU4_9BACT|nr:hypothetical protein GCM10007423_09740 [Dyadobacter endophyticus]
MDWFGNWLFTFMAKILMDFMANRPLAFCAKGCRVSFGTRGAEPGCDTNMVELQALGNSDPGEL